MKRRSQPCKEGVQSVPGRMNHTCQCFKEGPSMTVSRNREEGGVDGKVVSRGKMG